MKKILVTGATGFTGQHFIALAKQQGYEVVALTQSQTDIEGVQTHSVDLCDRESLFSIVDDIEFDAVLHLAAVSFVGHENIGEIYQANLIGTVNLLDAITAANKQVSKVVIASSGNVYGNAEHLPITESARLRPENDYAASKCAMEHAIACREHQLPIIVVRPFNYTGRGQAQHFLIPKLVQAFKARAEVIELGNTDVARDFSDVRDLVQCYLRLLRTPDIKGVFNFCSGQSVSLQTVIDTLQAITSHNIEVKVNPKFVRSNEIKDLYGSPNKLQEAIGEFRQFQLHDTLHWMLEE